MPDRLITDVFQIFLPNSIEAGIEVLPRDAVKRVRFGEIFTVAFHYQLGIPKVDTTVAFWVTWEASEFDLMHYGTPTVISIDPTHPREFYPGNNLVPPTDWQPGLVTAQAPEFPSPPPPGHSESSARIAYAAEVNMIQPDPPV